MPTSRTLQDARTILLHRLERLQDDEMIVREYFQAADILAHAIKHVEDMLLCVIIFGPDKLFE